MNFVAFLLCNIAWIVSMSASERLPAFSFDESRPNQERFLAYFNDLTPEHEAYCAWAVKKDLTFGSLRDANGYTPLERIFKEYARLQSIKVDNTDKDLLEKHIALKERWKSLFEALVKAGVIVPEDAGQRITQDEAIKSPELTLIYENYMELRKSFPAAFEAIRAYNVNALEELVKHHPKLVESVDPTTLKTVLHEATDRFDPRKAASVQIFAYLIRMGADVTMANENGISVADSMSSGDHDASELFISESSAIQNRTSSGYPIDQAIQQAKNIVQPLYNRAYPHGKYFGAGVIVCGFLWYFTRKRAGQSHIQVSHAMQLHRLSTIKG